MRLILGTRNQKKLEEMGEILSGSGVELSDLASWPNLPEVIEDGDSFDANARKKATEIARATRHWVLGEDSGLVVLAIGGRPGIYSARYAGKHGDDEANNSQLLAEMEAVSEDQRAAFYVCVAALADSHGEIHAVVEGKCHGRITRNRRGTNGFGYDPLFLIPEYHRTFGELSSRVKQALSHRARALAQLRPVLRQIMS